jgi:hypothetical protein
LDYQEPVPADRVREILKQEARVQDPLLKTIVSVFPHIYAQDILNNILFSMSYNIPAFNYLIWGSMTLFCLVLADSLYSRINKDRPGHRAVSIC